MLSKTHFLGIVQAGRRRCTKPFLSRRLDRDIKTHPHVLISPFRRLLRKGFLHLLMVFFMVNTISSMSLSLRNNGQDILYLDILFLILSFSLFDCLSTTKNIINVQLRKIICIIKCNCCASIYLLFYNN